MRTCTNCSYQDQRAKFCPECGHGMEAIRQQQATHTSILKSSPAEQREQASRSGHRQRSFFEPYLEQEEATSGRSGLSLVSLIISAFANIYQWVKLADIYSSYSSLGELFDWGVSISVSFILPTVFVFTAAVILNLIGYLTNHKYVTLTSAILYGIALILLPTWGYLAIPSLALQIIAFVKMPGKNDPSH